MKRRVLIKRIAGGLFAVVMAVTMAFIPEMGMGESVGVHAASGHWELVSKTSQTTPSPWKLEDFEGTNGTAPCTFTVDYRIKSLDDTGVTFTEKGSGSSYQASTGYYGNNVDMDAYCGLLGDSLSGGAKVSVPFKFTVRECSSSKDGKSAGISTCSLALDSPKWEIEGGYSYGHLKNTATSGYYAGLYGDHDGTFSGELPTGDKAGEKMDIYYRCYHLNRVSGFEGKNPFCMEVKCVYEWTTGSNSDTTKSLVAPKQTKITGIKIYPKNKKYYRVEFKKIKKNCEGYQFQISDNKKFKGVGKLHQGKWFGVNLNYGYLKGYKYNKTYYVRVRAFNYDSKTKEYKYGKWSKVKSFKWKIK